MFICLNTITFQFTLIVVLVRERERQADRQTDRQADRERQTDLENSCILERERVLCV